MSKPNRILFFRLLFAIVSALYVVAIFPKGNTFKYDFQKGKPWLYEDVYAPFDFPIYKTKEGIESEKDAIVKSTTPFYHIDNDIVDSVQKAYSSKFQNYFSEKRITSKKYNKLFKIGKKLIDSIYKNGVILSKKERKYKTITLVRKGNKVEQFSFRDLFDIDRLNDFLRTHLKEPIASKYANEFHSLFFEIIKQNVIKNEELTKKLVDKEIQNIALTRGYVDVGKRIISKGEVVEGEKYYILMSLKKEFQSEIWSDANYIWILVGYGILVSIVLSIHTLFVRKFSSEIYKSGRLFSLVITLLLLFVSINIYLIKYDYKYVYMVPMCIIPITLVSFFTTRIAISAYISTLLILGFVVSNSFEFIFLQTIAGFVTLITMLQLYRRANLFVVVMLVTLSYILGYVGFNIIQEGNLQNVDGQVIAYFFINGLAVLFVQPLIYMLEKLFGVVSDLSLLELSDTNSKLLKSLSEKAPGTFNHSLQVANLSESAATEIGANALLVRVGALYHDIGKMNDPYYFSENQLFGNSPHEKISPKESAKIIIKHVENGIEIAKKNKLPDKIIDFIRTHHGDSLVYYFYMQEKKQAQEVDEDLFRYLGPKPFSKEMAILMMADSIEAGTKSLKKPTQKVLAEFVNKIIDNQVANNQFINTEISFKDIQKIKHILKEKLMNIYNLRVEYPK